MNDPVLYLIPIELAPGTGSGVLGTYLQDTIRATQLFFVENVRTARRFISSLNLEIDISTLEFHVLNKHTEAAELSNYLTMLKTRSAGIMSEAGSPGIADPGSKLVALAHEHGIIVQPLVGPSAFILAMMGSGMNGQQFTFHGYLPVDKMQKKQAIKQLEKESAKTGGAQIFMETPYRNDQLLNDLIDSCHPQTRLCIACNLTAPDQMIQTLTIAQWKKQKPSLHKKPAVFIIQI